MHRLVNFSASVANSGFNLLLVLLIAKVVPTQDYAQFTAGLVYGGPFAVLLAFGNDTMLAKAFLVRPRSAHLVALARVLVFLPILAVILYRQSVPAAAGFALVAGTAVQQRFYFEATNKQLTVNAIGLVEKVLSIAGVLFLSRASGGGHGEVLFWPVIVAKLLSGLPVSAALIMGGGSAAIARENLREGVLLIRSSLPFLLGYVATQAPALWLVGNAASIVVADFGTASQVGAGLVAGLTLWQRPAVLRYLRNEVSIRRELVLSVALALAGVLVVYLGVILYGEHFKLLPGRSVIHGFTALALVTAVLHPFEVRGYACGRIPPRELVVAALVVLATAVATGRIMGFWAVPLAMALYQLVIFLRCRLWSAGDNPDSVRSAAVGDRPHQ